jgi:hypothetical protein
VDREDSIGIHNDSYHGHVGPNLESKPPRANRFGARSVVVSRDNLDSARIASIVARCCRLLKVSTAGRVDLPSDGLFDEKVRVASLKQARHFLLIGPSADTAADHVGHGHRSG